MAVSVAAGGMEAASEAEKASAVTVVEPQATLCSETDESFSKVDCADGVIRSRIEKRKRFGGARRFVCCYLRKMSPVKMLKKLRDCYVSSLGSCAQNYSSSHTPFGVGFMSCHASPLPPSLRMYGRHDDLHGSEFCLSPAFKKSLNDSLLALQRSGAFPDCDPGAVPFRKSFSDYESSVSPVMKRAYSDAATLYSRSPGKSRAGYYPRRSPGWTPTRALGGQTMMIFPIQEAPEVIRASFRKDSQELQLPSFRKEAQDVHLPSFREEAQDIHLPSCLKEGADQELTFKSDGELLSHLTADLNTAVSKLQVKEFPEANHASTPEPTAV